MYSENAGCIVGCIKNYCLHESMYWMMYCCVLKHARMSWKMYWGCNEMHCYLSWGIGGYIIECIRCVEVCQDGLGKSWNIISLVCFRSENIFGLKSGCICLCVSKSLFRMYLQTLATPKRCKWDVNTFQNIPQYIIIHHWIHVNTSYHTWYHAKGYNFLLNIRVTRFLCQWYWLWYCQNTVISYTIL